MKEKKKYIAFSFLGDSRLMTLNEIKEEIEYNALDCGEDDNCQLKKYLEDNPGETIEDYAKNKSKWGIEDLKNDDFYEYHGVEYFAYKTKSELKDILFDNNKECFISQKG